jgi:hypothetical protein
MGADAAAVPTGATPPAPGHPHWFKSTFMLENPDSNQSPPVIIENFLKAPFMTRRIMLTR